jgi:hypothetical protein
MVDSRNWPDLLATLVYDTKPVHVLPIASKCVEWNVKQKKVWCEKEKKKAFVKFLHLNMIDEYNHQMNLVDMADQLWGVYRPDHWMQMKKWCWAIWLWGLGVARTNGYKIYEVMYDAKLKKHRWKNVPPRWTHASFNKELVSNLIFPDETATAKHLAMLENMDNSTFAKLVSSMRRFLFYGTTAPKVMCDLTSTKGRDEYLRSTKPHRISQKRLEFLPAEMICVNSVSTLGFMSLMRNRGRIRRISRNDKKGKESLVAWCAM